MAARWGFGLLGRAAILAGSQATTFTARAMEPNIIDPTPDSPPPKRLAMGERAPLTERSANALGSSEPQRSSSIFGGHAFPAPLAAARAGSHMGQALLPPQPQPMFGAAPAAPAAFAAPAAPAGAAGSSTGGPRVGYSRKDPRIAPFLQRLKEVIGPAYEAAQQPPYVDGPAHLAEGIVVIPDIIRFGAEGHLFATPTQAMATCYKNLRRYTRPTHASPGHLGDEAFRQLVAEQPFSYPAEASQQVRALCDQCDVVADALVRFGRVNAAAHQLEFLNQLNEDRLCDSVTLGVLDGHADADFRVGVFGRLVVVMAASGRHGVTLFPAGNPNAPPDQRLELRLPPGWGYLLLRSHACDPSVWHAVRAGATASVSLIYELALRGEQPDSRVMLAPMRIPGLHLPPGPLQPHELAAVDAPFDCGPEEEWHECVHAEKRGHSFRGRKNAAKDGFTADGRSVRMTNVGLTNAAKDGFTADGRSVRMTNLGLTNAAKDGFTDDGRSVRMVNRAGKDGYLPDGRSVSAVNRVGAEGYLPDGRSVHMVNLMGKEGYTEDGRSVRSVRAGESKLASLGYLVSARSFALIGLRAGPAGPTKILESIRRVIAAKKLPAVAHLGQKP